MSSAFAVSPSLIEGLVLSQDMAVDALGDGIFACGDLKPNELCMSSWYRWTIQIQRTLSGPPITGRIATAHIQHASYLLSYLKRFRLFVLTPIEDAQTRQLLKADYYLEYTTCPPDTGTPDIDALLKERCAKQARSRGRR
jgi:hypothetical protein